MTHIAVISAGVSVPSSTRILADNLAAATVRALNDHALNDHALNDHALNDHALNDHALNDHASYDVIELREHGHALTDNVLTGFPTGPLADAVRRVAEADAVIAVSPVYTGSYSGLFKMFFDVLEDGTLEGKPVLIAATAGTARHSLVLEFAMRPLFAYLRADVVPTAVFAASSDFGAGGSDRVPDSISDSASAGTGGPLSQRVDRAAHELADKILRRGTTLPEDPFADPTPFEDLLRDI